jgi:hypothetical protein
MLTWYGLLKVVHVLSVVVWIGAATAFTAITSFLLGARDRAALGGWLPYTARYGQRFAGPASLLVLLSGAAMVSVAKLGFQTLWVAWGFAGIVAHFVYGATVMRKRAAELVPMVTTGDVDEALVARAGRRLIVGNAVYLLLMASVIVVMVLKPTL